MQYYGSVDNIINLHKLNPEDVDFKNILIEYGFNTQDIIRYYFDKGIVNDITNPDTRAILTELGFDELDLIYYYYKDANSALRHYANSRFAMPQEKIIFLIGLGFKPEKALKYYINELGIGHLSPLEQHQVLLQNGIKPDLLSAKFDLPYDKKLLQQPKLQIPTQLLGRQIPEIAKLPPLTIQISNIKTIPTKGDSNSCGIFASLGNNVNDKQVREDMTRYLIEAINAYKLLGNFVWDHKENQGIINRNPANQGYQWVEAFWNFKEDKPTKLFYTLLPNQMLTSEGIALLARCQQMNIAIMNPVGSGIYSIDYFMNNPDSKDIVYVYNKGLDGLHFEQVQESIELESIKQRLHKDALTLYKFYIKGWDLKKNGKQINITIPRSIASIITHKFAPIIIHAADIKEGHDPYKFLQEWDNFTQNHPELNLNSISIDAAKYQPERIDETALQARVFHLTKVLNNQGITISSQQALREMLFRDYYDWYKADLSGYGINHNNIDLIISELYPSTKEFIAKKTEFESNRLNLRGNREYIELKNTIGNIIAQEIDSLRKYESVSAFVERMQNGGMLYAMLQPQFPTLKQLHTTKLQDYSSQILNIAQKIPQRYEEHLQKSYSHSAPEGKVGGFNSESLDYRTNLQELNKYKPEPKPKPTHHRALLNALAAKLPFTYNRW